MDSNADIDIFDKIERVRVYLIDQERRLLIQSMKEGTLSNFAFKRSKSNPFVWDFSITGPIGSPWAALFLTGYLTFPSTFPRGRLTFHFKPPLWHPNVNSVTGFVCLGDESSSAKDRIEKGRLE